MNIKSTVYENTIGIEFSPDDFHTMNLSPRAVIDFSGGACVLVPTETAIAMRDRLNELFPPEPDEPESDLPEEPEPIEDGFYVTQDGTLIYRDSGNQPCEYIVYTNPPAYYNDWHHVYEDFDASALPLTHVTVDDFRKLVRK